jgi:hypothetical protein
MSSWHTQCGIRGGFMWLYDDFASTGKAAQYASAINTAVGSGSSGGTGTTVNLNSSFDRVGIYSDGTTFSSSGGIDGVGYAYSSSYLTSSLTWNSTIFTIGQANSSNVISAASQKITLTAGKFSTLRMLGTGVNGNQISQAFTVTYSDGTTTSFIQNLSDWYTSQGYSGESVAVAMAYRDTSSGGKDSRTFNLYGYTFNLNNAKTVQSITLPANSSVEVVAITLQP